MNRTTVQKISNILLIIAAASFATANICASYGSTIGWKIGQTVFVISFILGILNRPSLADRLEETKNMSADEFYKRELENK